MGKAEILEQEIEEEIIEGESIAARNQRLYVRIRELQKFTLETMRQPNGVSRFLGIPVATSEKFDYFSPEFSHFQFVLEQFFTYFDRIHNQQHQVTLNDVTFFISFAQQFQEALHRSLTPNQVEYFIQELERIKIIAQEYIANHTKTEFGASGIRYAMVFDQNLTDE